MYSAHLSSRPGWASFFSDWNTMYIETMLAPPDFRHFERLIVNVENGALDRREYTRLPKDQVLEYFPLTGGILLGIVAEPNPYRPMWLIRAALPDYKEIARVPCAVTSAAEGSKANAYGHTLPTIGKHSLTRSGAPFSCGEPRTLE
jgi:hypothetical protein